jgi:UDP-N-acetylglucosamine/UDP-N-acetylgalactosamine diphosphorylase
MAPPTYSEVSSLLSSYQQSHLLHHYASLPAASQSDLLRSISSLDLPRLYGKILPLLLSPPPASTSPIAPFPASRTLPPPSPTIHASLSSLGRPLVLAGKVCCLVLAGGQGTRLGYPGVKGSFPLSPRATLFDHIFRRGRALSASITWLVMTSPMNHAETVAYFRSKSNYGLPESQVRFFPQGTLPCLSPPADPSSTDPLSYKILLSSPSSVALAPDGNGGVYNALLSSGLLASLTSAGAEYLHVFSVDNALARPADPCFVGLLEREGADAGNKVLWKKDAGEKVGVMALDGGGGRAWWSTCERSERKEEPERTICSRSG